MHVDESPTPSPHATVGAPLCGRVLVADDEPDCRASLTELLRRAGYSCSEADSAPAVLAAVETEPVDLVVADIQMPGNGALELLHAFAQTPAAPPVLLLTGQASLATATEAVRLNAVGYLLKPVDPAELLPLVRDAIDAHQIRRMMRGHRARLDHLLVKMRQLEPADRSPAASVAGEALSAYVALSTEHFLGAVTDLRNLVDAIVARDTRGEVALRLASSRPLLLIDALRETILVLERTKTSFKSRELAELRQKLEALVTRHQRA